MILRFAGHSTRPNNPLSCVFQALARGQARSQMQEHAFSPARGEIAARYRPRAKWQTLAMECPLHRCHAPASRMLAGTYRPPPAGATLGVLKAARSRLLTLLRQGRLVFP